MNFNGAFCRVVIMSIECRLRRFNFTKEHEVVNKISKLLKVLTNSGREVRPRVQKQEGGQPLKKFNAKTKSFCPRVTFFDFVSAKLVKAPALSNISLPEIVNSPGTSMKKHHKAVKRREKSYMLPCNLQRKVIQTLKVEDTNRFKRIIKLTEDLINKENLGGWNEN